MAEIREKQVMVNMEPTFYDNVQQLSADEGVSASTYVRSLIIRDQLRRGMLDEQRLTEILIGKDE